MSTLEIKVIPGAPRDEVVGWLGGTLKLRIRAPALAGRANDAVLAFLAARLGRPRRDLTLIRGEKARQKAVRIAGLTPDEIRSRLGMPSVT